jgi:hypothetical protein
VHDNRLPVRCYLTYTAEKAKQTSKLTAAAKVVVSEQMGFLRAVTPKAMYLTGTADKPVSFLRMLLLFV